MIESKINVICNVILSKIGVIPNLTPPQFRARKYSCQITFTDFTQFIYFGASLDGERRTGSRVYWHYQHDSYGKSHFNCLLSPKQELRELQLKRKKQPAQEPWSHQRETRSQRHEVTQKYSQVFSFCGTFSPQTA